MNQLNECMKAVGIKTDIYVDNHFALDVHMHDTFKK